MANVPKESVPNWPQEAKKAADAVADKAVQILKEGPTVLVEDIGQGFMDQVQTSERIAAVSGTVVGFVTGGIAGVKAKPKIKAKIEKLLESFNNGAEQPLKLSTRFLNKNDKLWEYAENIESIDGYQDIVCHGDQYSFVFKDANGIETNVSVKEFAEILQNSPVYEGGPIRLISCETGAEGAVSAQYLSNYLEVEVMAPTDIVYVYSDGSMKIGLDNSGFWKIFKPGGK